ncbi:MAG: flagellar biosynthetic protein FliO [Gammaproteobacteria bacterium]|nr:flagellar biosynthetic protein FliO [Gammaproteobacteria bacterium]MCP5298849.1 flagellar biosynthetic protein FliO [Chromatiaceae bacterium]
MRPNHPFALMPAAAALFAVQAAAAADTVAARKIESPLSGVNVMETFVGLAIVVGVMLALAWLVKRFVQVPGMGRGQVQVLGGVSLGAREKAVLLAVDGRRLLVGVAPGRVQTLLELGTVEAEVPDFAAELGGATARREASR